jgi:hypothetical protein
MRSWHLVCLLAVLSATLFLASGCASSKKPEPATVDYRGIERPARPVGEEESVSDRMGQVGVVLLVVLVTAGFVVGSIFLAQQL